MSVMRITLAGFQAELIVEVRSHGNADERPIEVEFRPAQLKLDVGETRNVNLMLDRTHSQPVTVVLSTSSSAVTVPASVSVQAGTRMISVPVSGAGAGKAVITASLPETLGGDTAQLAVEVRNK